MRVSRTKEEAEARMSQHAFAWVERRVAGAVRVPRVWIEGRADRVGDVDAVYFEHPTRMRRLVAWMNAQPTSQRSNGGLR